MPTEPRSAPESGGRELFVWPPRDTDDHAPAPPAAAPSVQRSPLGDLIESIETDLLGRTTLSFDRWAQRTGWSPDAPDRYCWRCAGSVGPHEQDGEGCATCRKRKLPWDRALRLGLYDGQLRDEVLALKFHAWRPGGSGLGLHLGRVIEREFGRAELNPAQIRLVPIPTHRWRRIARGVDHTLVLARAAARATGCPVSTLLRARYRAEQIGLSATARARNMNGAFVTDPRRLRRELGRTGQGVRAWVLIDDVQTTGATFVEAARTLRRGLQAASGGGEPPEIWVCSVAVAGQRARRRGADE